MTAAWARRLLVVLVVAALTWALSTARPLDLRVLGALGVLLETAILARLSGRAIGTALLGGGLAAVNAGLALWFVGAVLGPAYPAVARFVLTPWPAALAVLAFGAVSLLELRLRPLASSAPSAPGSAP